MSKHTLSYSIRLVLAKPFEWIMRGAFKIHLALDGNSEWICHTFDEQRQIQKESGCKCL
jgi:hypothetical protein